MKLDYETCFYILGGRKMYQKVKKQLVIMLCMLMVMISATGTWVVNAESDYIVISNISATGAVCDWSGLVSVYAAEGKKIDSFKVTLSAVGYPDKVLSEAATATGVTLYNLAPDNYYQIVIEPTYHYYEEESQGVYEQHNGYEWKGFNTLQGAAQSTVNPSAQIDATQQTENQAAATQTPATQVPVEQTPVTVTAATPAISKVKMHDTTVYINANQVTAFRICTKKGKVVATDTSYTTGDTFYGIKANKVYYAQVRSYLYDANYNKVYSAWSGKKYFVAQPTINTSTSKINANADTISLKWNKVQGASSYTVYMKKSTANKWKKVKTTKKNTYKTATFKGNALHLKRNDYHIKVVANAKINGKKYKSNNAKYIYTYVIFR